MKCIQRVFLVLLLCSLLSACRQSDFDGSIVKNEVEFTLAFQSFNTTVSHAFDLSKGDAILVEIVCEAGTLSATIQKDGDDPIYSGSVPPSGGFQVEIQKSGIYQITVKGERSKGSAAFSVIGGQ